ncbi:MAG: metal ABC transporter permease, partial [Planctomycetales bacterium]|nr:metal ABC transporter permease [Planctomycetales bacterium]
MVAEFFSLLSTWQPLDTWIVVTAALASMACSLPGAFLLLRRQSMMGDALSHTMLLGIVGGYLVAMQLRSSGWLPAADYLFWRQTLIFAGAIVIGVVSALLTQAVEKIGRVEPSAALGVVFTTLFALGLVTLRIQADHVDLDPDCVLYGMVETTALDTVGQSDVPVAA